MENVYLKTKNKIECNGCTACAYICPKQCIAMKEDNEGFIYPVIDETKCVHCSKCLTVCSNTYKREEKRKIIPFAIINNDKQILSKSTSGGTFYALLADLFSKSNSVCYGAAYDANLEVKHMRAETLEDAMKFMGSKYVRSNICGIYEQVKKDLLEGKNVLFTGTPCMTAGLYTYLKRDADNLLTCNIICHSNPSPKVFSKYIKCLELTKGSKVKSVTFRAKETGWRNATPVIELETGAKFEEDTFAKAFSRTLISRPSCSDCKFIEPYNFADITIGDFWGVEKLTALKDVEDGISLVYANTKKGLDELNKLKGVTKHNLDENLNYLMYNHHTPVKAHRNREKFFNKLDKTKDKDIIKLINNMSKERLFRRILKRLKILK
ncbi:MAG: Coenzyme F420 hydrogenase/dehydrogenase, beta subunit C-terminal domain [Clostridia bacterium]|nr:Coenzyme F420 hydrogenase/dehydrogenase, beta subunit C-terminal domain [Clostridia bacterium]